MCFVYLKEMRTLDSKFTRGELVVVKQCDADLVLTLTLMALVCDYLHTRATKFWLRGEITYYNTEERKNLQELHISSSYLARLQRELNNPSLLIYIHVFICTHPLSLYLAFLQFLKAVKTDRSELHYCTELNLVVCSQTKLLLTFIHEPQECTGCHAVANSVSCEVWILTCRSVI